jgi:magnesium-transporting ATPase (P-type)
MDGLSTLPWHAAAATDVAREVACDPRAGLSAAEAAARLARHGPNTISAKRGRPWWVRLLL